MDRNLKLRKKRPEFYLVFYPYKLRKEHYCILFKIFFLWSFQPVVIGHDLYKTDLLIHRETHQSSSHHLHNTI